MPEEGKKDFFSKFPPQEPRLAALDPDYVSQMEQIRAKMSEDFKNKRNSKKPEVEEVEYDLSGFPSIPPPPPVPHPNVPMPPPLLTIEEMQVENGSDPALYYLEKKYLEARLDEVKTNGLPITDATDEEEDEYNQAKIKKEAQSLAPDAIKALSRILKGEAVDKNDAKTVPTNAQILRAAEIILDRAGDKPATAPPDESGKKQAYLILNTGVLPTNDG